MKNFLFALFFCGTMTALHAEDTKMAVPAKAALCSACHGQEGVSANPAWPNLAGQHASYLIKQLNDYKKGTNRYDATMAAILTAVNEQEIIELARFYSAQPIASGLTPEKYANRGERLYRSGDFSKHIAACIACHGPHGTGNGQAGLPAIAGQHAPYIIAQLKAYKEKTRSNDLNGIMHDLSARMSLEDMEAVAYYIQGLH